MPPGAQCLPFSCDSFDAAIAAHINKNRGNNGVEKSSVLDAEETCDAFTFFRKSHTGVEKEDCRSDGNIKDVNALTDVYWVSFFVAYGGVFLSFRYLIIE